MVKKVTLNSELNGSKNTHASSKSSMITTIYADVQHHRASHIQVKTHINAPPTISSPAFSFAVEIIYVNSSFLAPE